MEQRSEHYYETCFGPMEPAEREFLLENGYAKEDSKGNLTGEASTLFEESVIVEEAEIDVDVHSKSVETIFHVNGEPVNILRRSSRINVTELPNGHSVLKQAESSSVGLGRLSSMEKENFSLDSPPVDSPTCIGKRLRSATKKHKLTPMSLGNSTITSTNGDTTMNLLFATPQNNDASTLEKKGSAAKDSCVSTGRIVINTPLCQEVKRSARILKLKENQLTPKEPVSDNYFNLEYWKTPKTFYNTPPPSEITKVSSKKRPGKATAPPTTPLLFDVETPIAGTPQAKHHTIPKVLEFKDLTDSLEKAQTEEKEFEEVIEVLHIISEESTTSHDTSNEANLMDMSKDEERDDVNKFDIEEKVEEKTEQKVEEDKIEDVPEGIEIEESFQNINASLALFEELEIFASSNIEVEAEPTSVLKSLDANEGNVPIQISPIGKITPSAPSSDLETETEIIEKGIAEITIQELNTTFNTESLSESIANISIPDADAQKELTDDVNLMDFSTISLFTRRSLGGVSKNHRNSTNLIDFDQTNNQPVVAQNSPQRPKELSYASPMKNRKSFMSAQSPLTPGRRSIPGNRSFNLTKNLEISKPCGSGFVSNDFARSTSLLLNPSSCGSSLNYSLLQESVSTVNEAESFNMENAGLDDSVTIMEKLLEEAEAAEGYDSSFIGSQDGNVTPKGKENQMKLITATESPKFLKAPRVSQLMKENPTRPSPPRPKSLSSPKRPSQVLSPKRKSANTLPVKRPLTPVKNPTKMNSPLAVPSKIIKPKVFISNPAASEPKSAPTQKTTFKTPVKPLNCKIPTPMSSAKKMGSKDAYRNIQSPVSCYIYNQPVLAKVVTCHRSPCHNPNNLESKFNSPSKTSKIPSFRKNAAAAGSGGTKIPMKSCPIQSSKVESTKLPVKEIAPTTFKAADGKIGPLRGSIPIAQMHLGARTSVSDSIVEQTMMPRKFVPEHVQQPGSRLRLPTNSARRCIN